jgi:6-phosphogluconolactonase (cycloisomerase 2 family)
VLSVIENIERTRCCRSDRDSSPLKNSLDMGRRHVNLKPFRFWKGEIISLSLGVSLSLVGASPLWAQTAGFAYVTNAGGSVSAYDINAKTGALVPVAGSPFATGVLPVSVAVHPSGRFAYVANAGIPTGAYSVSAYAVKKTGALTAILGSPFATGVQPASVTVNPNGRFVYVADAGLDVGDISVYAVNATTGALSPVPGSPFAAGHEATSLAVSPNGRFVYVTNNILQFSDLTGGVSAFVVNATTGALAPVEGSPFAAGMETFGVAIHPNGRFAYAANALSNDVSVYSINATTGALTPIPGSPFAADFGSISVALSPNGQFAYVANVSADDVSAFTINTTTGGLAPVPGSPFAAGPGPFSVAVSPDGQFAYVANQFSSDVSAYTIDATTGALTPVADSPFAAGGSPTSVTTTAPEKRCKHHDEEERVERDDRDERRDGRRQDDNEHREGGDRDDDEHQSHRFDGKHGCQHFGEKDFEEHDNDDAQERGRDHF